VVWGYKVKVIDRGLLSSADVGGICSSSKVDRGHSLGLCGGKKPGSKSNQFDTGKQKAQRLQNKTRGYFSRRLIQNFWQWEGIVKENDSQCLAKNVIFQKNEYGM
jgi:hypothetical protein